MEIYILYAFITSFVYATKRSTDKFQDGAGWKSVPYLFFYFIAFPAIEAYNAVKGK